MISPVLTRIGEPQRTIEVERPPIPIRRRMVPIKVPEKVPVRPIPQRKPDRKVWEDVGFIVEEISYSCPRCGRDLEAEDGVFYCPAHGVVYE